MRKKTFGKALRPLWARAGFDTQQEFAQAIGLDPASVSQWSSGKRLPKLATIEVIAKVLNQPIAKILALRSGEDHERTTGIAKRLAPEQQQRHANRDPTARVAPELRAAIQTAVDEALGDVALALLEVAKRRRESRRS